MVTCMFYSCHEQYFKILIHQQETTCNLNTLCNYILMKAQCLHTHADVSILEQAEF